MHPSVHSSIIYNSQDVEVTQVSTNRQLDKDVVYIDNGILAIKKQWNSAIWSNVGELENTMLSEISQTKTNTVWYHLYV